MGNICRGRRCSRSGVHGTGRAAVVRQGYRRKSGRLWRDNALNPEDMKRASGCMVMAIHGSPGVRLTLNVWLRNADVLDAILYRCGT